ncbi:MAG: CoA transferase subunit A [Deltaproteobacteria bacterium]|nr:CoA transferase subunit A [Deltaproteobacteria bacterium]
MSVRTERKQKLLSLEEAVSLIPSGSAVALGGLGLYGAPMGFVREMIRQRIRDLSLILSPGASMQADLLIGAGCVREVQCSYIGFEDLGLAPNFRRVAESGKLRIVDSDEAHVVFGLRAGAAGAPFFPLAEGMAGFDVARVNPNYFPIQDPRTGKTHLCVAAINPDVAVIHVGQCDHYGNARHLGSRFTDLLMAKAAKKKRIVTCDEMIDLSATQKEPHLTSVPGYIVDAVVHLPYGCHPASSPGLYERDEQHLRSYLKRSASEEGFRQYLEEFVLGLSPAQYAEKIGQERLRLLSQRGT